MKLKNRPRKILNTEERILVILMYDENPVYQQVASVFKCSWEQIKSVIMNSENILRNYTNTQSWKPEDDAKVKRMKKICFLGSLMYEFIKRAYFYSQLYIDEEAIKEKAKEFKNILNIEKFFPNNAWIQDFQHNYSIILSQLDWLVIPKTPKQTLDCKDIIEHCRKMLDKALIKLKQIEETNKINAKTKNLSVESNGYNTDCYDDEPDESMVENEEGEIMYFNYDDDEIVNNSNGNQIENASTTSLPKPNNKKKTAFMSNLTVPLPKIIKMEQNSRPSTPTSLVEPFYLTQDISTRNVARVTNYAEALKHLQPLEDFALEIGDFRAINLLSTLMDVYGMALKKQNTK